MNIDTIYTHKPDTFTHTQNRTLIEYVTRNGLLQWFQYPAQVVEGHRLQHPGKPLGTSWEPGVWIPFNILLD